MLKELKQLGLKLRMTAQKWLTAVGTTKLFERIISGNIKLVEDKAVNSLVYAGWKNCSLYRNITYYKR